MNDLRQVATEYATHGLAVIPALPLSKEPAVSWRALQWEPPTDLEREAMFANDRCNLNIAIVCGSPSRNLAMIDAETPREFDRQLRQCRLAGIDNTWIDRSPRGGGHIWMRLPVAVKPLKRMADVEVRAQGQYALAPPSVWKNGPIHAPYEFLNKPPSIIEIASLDEIHWLKLEPVAARLTYRSLPRKAKELLSGSHCRSRTYASRSEVEQAIITTLVNAGFPFEEILTVFRHYPAAGKFAELDRLDQKRAVDWLRTSFNEARSWCIQQSPGRRLAGEQLAFASVVAWPGKTGSADRAVYIAHTGLAYRSGKGTYHASARELAELAGCGRVTAARATKRLVSKGLIERTQIAAFAFAAKYQLVKKTNIDPLPHNGLIGVVQTSSFLLPEAFRQRGLGRSAYEVLNALGTGPLTVKEIAKGTGRHVQTIRRALAKLREYGHVVKTGRTWRGRGLEDIDLDDLARAVGMRGALQHQRAKHSADRLRHKVSMAVEERKGVN